MCWIIYILPISQLRNPKSITHLNLSAMSIHKPKGNILFIVMFILLLSSMIWLLIVNYVRQIFASSAMFYDYYQAYYLANAGVELGLTKIKYRGYGFEDRVWSGSDINTIRTCNIKPCQTIYDIQANHTVLSDTIQQPTSCDNDQRYLKQAGQNLIVPLFSDQQADIEQSITNRVYASLNTQEIASLTLSASGNNVKYAVALLVSDPQEEFVDSVVQVYQQNKLILSSLTNSGNMYGESILSKLDGKNHWFLIISNLSDQPLSLCLQSNSKLPTSTVLLSTQWHYRDSVVSLQAIKKVAIPDDYAYAAIWWLGE